MEFVTVVNRTKKVLAGKWDGRDYAIPLGKSMFPRIQAEKFKLQNPIMGSEDPRTGQCEYKIGIEENKDRVDMLPDDLKEGIEKWDRSKLVGARPTEVVDGDNGLYALGRTAGSGNVVPTVGFESNKGTDRG